MEPTPRITRDPPGSAAADYRHLYRHGLARVQQLAEKTWTDYNDHDPGVTILQLLCYALTDVGYRVDHPIEDILAPAPESNGEPPPDSLYTGEKVLTCDPLTTNDYRKLLYDRIGGLRNAWLVPAGGSAGASASSSASSSGIRGLYDVRLQTWQQSLAGISPDVRLLRSAAALLRGNRNIGEDFDTIEVLEPLKITLGAEIRIDFDDKPEDILASALFELGDELIPFPRVKNIDTRFQEGVPPDEIFVGPRLDYGDIDDTCLEDLPASVTVETIVSIIRNTPGVENVRDLQVTIEGGAGETHVYGMVPPRPIFLPKGHVPYLDVGASIDKLNVLRDGFPQDIDATRVQKSFEHLVRLRLDRELYARRRMHDIGYRLKPWGRHRDLGHYSSIQREFPAAYGLGAYGIPNLVTRTLVDDAEHRSRREAQVMQLKAYLLFFEQVLANQLAQLANVPRLFSLDSRLDQTYFWQEATDAPRIESVMGWESGDGETSGAATGDDGRLRRYRRGLGEILRRHDPRLDRRERLLDHLLARFNERFEDEELELLRREQTRRRNSGERDKVRIRWKREFLADFVRLSSGRGLGIDYSVAAGYGVDVVDRESRRVILRGRRNVSSRSAANARRMQILALGSDPDNYRSADEAGRLQLVDADGDVVATKPLPDKPEEDTEPTAAALAARIRRMTERAEAEPDAVIEVSEPHACAMERRVSLLAGCSADVYLLEHVLLRPASKSGVAEPAWSPDEYSLSASFFFPGWQRRFQSTDYHQFAERVVRENCPAHIAIACYWLSAEHLREFKPLYLEWRDAKAEGCAYVDGGHPEQHRMLDRVDELAARLRRFVDARRANRDRESAAGGELG